MVIEHFIDILSIQLFEVLIEHPFGQTLGRLFLRNLEILESEHKVFKIVHQPPNPPNFGRHHRLDLGGVPFQAGHVGEGVFLLVEVLGNEELSEPRVVHAVDLFPQSRGLVDVVTHQHLLELSPGNGLLVFFEKLIDRFAHGTEFLFFGDFEGFQVDFDGFLGLEGVGIVGEEFN